MNLGINISREGYDANTTDMNRLVCSSLKTELKILNQYTKRITIPNGGYTVSDKENHGLGYAPSFLAYFKGPDSSYWCLTRTRNGSLSILSRYDVQVRVDKTYIYFNATRGDSGSSGDQNIDIRYFIMDQPAIMGAAGSDTAIGYQSSTHGIIVSMPGIDATLSKIYQRQFDSNTNYLKYYYTKTGTLLWNNSVAGSAVGTVTHNLGYVPMYSCYGTFPTLYTYYGHLPIGRSPQPWVSSAGADKTNIKIEIVWAASFYGGFSGDFDYRVVIYENDMLY